MGISRTKNKMDSGDWNGAEKISMVPAHVSLSLSPSPSPVRPLPSHPTPSLVTLGQGQVVCESGVDSIWFLLPLELRVGVGPSQLSMPDEGFGMAPIESSDKPESDTDTESSSRDSSESLDVMGAEVLVLRERVDELKAELAKKSAKLDAVGDCVDQVHFVLSEHSAPANTEGKIGSMLKLKNCEMQESPLLDGKSPCCIRSGMKRRREAPDHTNVVEEFLEKIQKIRSAEDDVEMWTREARDFAWRWREHVTYNRSEIAPRIGERFTCAVFGKDASVFDLNSWVARPMCYSCEYAKRFMPPHTHLEKDSIRHMRWRITGRGPMAGVCKSKSYGVYVSE